MIDLYGASVSLEVKNSQGKFVPISSLVGPGVLDANVTFVESVSVKVSILRLFELEVNLAPPFYEGIKLLQSGLLGVGFHYEKSTGVQSLSVDGQSTKSKTKINLNEMRVQISYGGKTSRAYNAFLLPPEIDLGLDGISIKMRGIGLLWKSTKNNSRSTFTSETRESIIRKLLNDGQDVTVEVSDKAKDALSVPETLNQNKQDHEMVQDLLEKSNCVGMEIGADQLGGMPVYQIKHKSETRNTQSSASFVAYQQIDPNRGVFPLLSISTSTTNLELPGGAFGKKAYTFNKDSKTSSTTDVGPSTYVQGDGKSPGVSDKVATGDPTMAGANVDADGNPVPGGPPIGMPEKAGSTSLLDRVKGAVHDYMDKVFEYELSTVGIVDMLPGQMVNVAVGDVGFLTGAYDLWEVTHTVSMEGCETKMTCFRTGGLATLVTSGATKVPTVAGKVASLGNRIIKTAKTPDSSGLL